MEEDLTFDTIPAKFCGMVEQYRIELAKKNPIELHLDVSLPWKTICWIHETVLISKKFEFIKRLVENNKINFSIIPNKIKEIWIPMKINWEIKYWFDSSDYYWLLMLLSISDNPISDLISYLK